VWDKWVIHKTKKKAREYYQLGCDHQDAESQFQMGYIYYRGEGIPKNNDLAHSYFKLAADQGHSEAQRYLGLFYVQGWGSVPKDAKQAISYWTASAKQGNKDAQYSLGECYENGYGVVQNFYDSMKWYRAAAHNGHEEGDNAKKRIQKVIDERR